MTSYPFVLSFSSRRAVKRRVLFKFTDYPSSFFCPPICVCYPSCSGWKGEMAAEHDVDMIGEREVRFLRYTTNMV